MPQYAVAHTIQAHAGAVHVARYNRGGRYLLTGGGDQQVRLWNAHADAPPELDAKGRSPCIQQYTGHSYEVLCLDVAPDNARFASGGPDRAVLVWDVASGQTLRRLNAHSGRTQDVRFIGARDDGSVLLAGGSDTVLRAYDLRASGAWRPIFEAHEARDAILAIAASTSCIHTASVDGVLRTYDIRKGQLRADVIDQPISAITPTRDGAAILASTLDSTHRLLDLHDGTELQRFRGHVQTSFRCHAALAADEAQVLAGDEDGRVLAWDVVSGHRSWGERPDYSGSVRHRRAPNASVAVLWTEANPDVASHGFVSASSCGTVHVWGATKGQGGGRGT
ncbi:hypothetical protein MSPP1_002393 [Malassezia sp. CBS 17886]|nr:hypothetical protein MSPP1_002393 [Malassezia sp. CBS 17886]